MRKPTGILHFLQLLHLTQEQEEAAAPEPTFESQFDLDSDIFPISYYSTPEDLLRWLKWRGYRVVAGGGGVVFGRKNGPVTIAVVGDVLEYDGVNVVVMD